MNSTPNMPESIDFGSFRILPYRRELLSNGEPLKIGGRAFELLMVLIERPGAVVGKDELMARVWPGRVVGETNLQTQILALRDVLEPERDLIRTVCGRGYQFTGHIDSAWVASNCHAPQSVSMAIDAVPPPTNLPQPVSELIGRGDEIAALLDLVRAGRLVTLTGPGGIG